MMMNGKWLSTSPIALVILALAGGTAAAQPATPPAAPAASVAAPAAGAAALSEGEVRRLDKATGRITLRHGEIRNLDMPPMTMVFTVRDVALLDRVQVGEKVRFRVIEEGGKYVVTEIQPAR